MQGWVTDGDSITISTSGGTEAQTYPEVAKVSFTAGTYLNNAAVAGFTCQDARDHYAAAVAPFYNSHRLRNVASIMCGANSNPAGDDAVAYAAILTWVASAQATGFSPVVFTMISRVSAAAFKNALNTRIRNGAVANGYTVADAGSDPNIGCDACYLDTTYFSVDGIHPNATGEALIATGYAEPTLASLGFN